MRIGAAVPETRRGRIDEARIARMQAIPSVTELFHRTGAEVLDERVGLVEQPLEDLATLRRFKVERDRLLAAVDRGKIGRFAVLERAVMARVVALLGRLDLDHSRPEL